MNRTKTNPSFSFVDKIATFFDLAAGAMHMVHRDDEVHAHDQWGIYNVL